MPGMRPPPQHQSNTPSEQPNQGPSSQSNEIGLPQGFVPSAPPAYQYLGDTTDSFVLPPVDEDPTTVHVTALGDPPPPSYEELFKS